MNYKLSQFNVKKKISSSEIALFNTLKKSMVIMSEKYYDDLAINAISNIQELNSLEELGFILNKEIDEYKVFKYMLNKEKFNSDILTITFLNTRECNFQCTYCFETDNNSLENNEYNIENLIDRLIISLKDFYRVKGFKHLDFNFFGGEPTLNIKSIEDVINKIKKISDNKFTYSFHLVSNGYLLTKKMLLKLKHLGIESIQFTLDGDEVSHNKTRKLINGDETLKTIYANLLSAIDLGFDITLSLNYNFDNYKNIINLINFIPDQYKEKIYIKFNEIVGTITNKENNLNSEERVQIKQILYSNEEILKYNMKDIEYLEDGPCLFNKVNSVIINTNGDLSKCLYSIDDNRYNIGNIYKDDLFNILSFNRSKFAKVHEGNLKCKTCEVLPICKEGCFREIQDNNNYCKKESFLQGEINLIFNKLLEGLI